MGIVFILLIIIAFILLLLFAIDAKLRLLFDSDRNDMHFTVSWIYPFIKGIGKLENNRPIITIYIFGLHLFKKSINPGKNKGGIKKTDMLKIFNLKDVTINTKYGFTNPSSTGITCGAINAASQFINIDFLNQVPDFMSAHDYIYFDAKASVNLGASLTNLIKYLKNRRKFQWIRTQT